MHATLGPQAVSRQDAKHRKDRKESPRLAPWRAGREICLGHWVCPSWI